MHLTINVNGEDILLEHHNCKVYRFRKLPELDHAYYEEGRRCFYVFDCDALFDAMEADGCETVTSDYPSENDYDAYVKHTASHVDEELEELDGGL